jgi:hypothetical protein
MGLKSHRAWLETISHEMPFSSGPGKIDAV